MIIHKNAMLVFNNDTTISCIQLLRVWWQYRCVQCERKRRVNDILSYKFCNQRAALSYPSKVNVLVGFIAKMVSDALIAPSQQWVSMEHQQFLALHLGQAKGCTRTLIHNRTIGCLSRQQCIWQNHWYVLKISINGASTERQWFLVIQLASSKCCASALTHNQSIGHHDGQKH